MIYKARYIIVCVVLSLLVGIGIAQEAEAPTPIVVDTPVTATIAEGELPRYIVSVPANTLYQIDVVSDDFNPSMVLYDEDDQNIGSNQDKVQGVPDARMFVYPTTDTDYTIQIGSQSGVGDYTISVSIGGVIIEDYVETTLDVEIEPGDSAYIAFPVTQNDIFNIGYTNRDSANLRLSGELYNSNGGAYGKSLNGANITSYAVIAKETENVGLLIKSPADATEPTTATVTFAPVEKISLDDGPQSAVLQGRNALVFALTAEANMVYPVSIAPDAELPESIIVTFVQAGEEVGDTRLNGGAFFANAIFSVTAPESGEFLAILSITGNIDETEFPLTVSAEPMP